MIDPMAKALAEAKTIAVVGLSNNRARPAYSIARYLQQHGYKIIPVHPAEQEVLGEKAYPNLDAVPVPVDIVDIFRNPMFVPAIVEAAIRVKAHVVWMQPGAENYEAAQRAEDAGLETIVGMCIRTEHMMSGT